MWSNARIIKWISDIGLDDFADYLRQSGIHGAVFVFDETFDADIFAYYLQIPNSNEAVSDSCYTTIRFTASFQYSPLISLQHITAWKVSKYGVFSGPYFPLFGLNTGKYGPEKTPYLDTFHAVYGVKKRKIGLKWVKCFHKIWSCIYLLNKHFVMKSHLVLHFLLIKRKKIQKNPLKLKDVKVNSIHL